MTKPKYHIFMCASFRTSGEPQGVCFKKGCQQLLPYMENEILDRGLADVSLSSTGCLKVCDRGPAMVVYPANWWFGGVNSEEAVDEILDALEEDRPAEKYLIS